MTIHRVLTAVLLALPLWVGAAGCDDDLPPPPPATSPSDDITKPPTGM